MNGTLGSLGIVAKADGAKGEERVHVTKSLMRSLLDHQFMFSILRGHLMLVKAETCSHGELHLRYMV